MRASLTSLGRRLPDLTADLALLADLVDQDAPDALARTRAVVDKVLAAICADEDIVIDGGTETMLETLLERQVIPLAIAAQVRAVHDRENTLVGDAVRALVGFLEWRIGSRAHLRYIPKPPKRRRIVAILIAAITVVTIAIVIAAWPRPAQDLASGAMVQIAGATLELGSRPEERQAALALCRTIEHRPDCELDNEELAQEHARTVTISTFELDRHEVTVSAYAEWLTREPPAPDNLVALPNLDYDHGVYSVKPDRQQLPVQGVTWDRARAYCEAVHKRLPTEAEWELAARGSERRTFPWGSAPPRCNEVVHARLERRPCYQTGPEEPAAVASAPKDVTPEGVYDLGGNVSEWTADPVGSTYVLRGGNFGSWLGWTRAAHRTIAEAAATRTNIGFRCAR